MPAYGGQWTDSSTGQFDQKGYDKYLADINKKYIANLAAQGRVKADNPYAKQYGVDVNEERKKAGLKPLTATPLDQPITPFSTTGNALGVAGAGAAGLIGKTPGTVGFDNTGHVAPVTPIAVASAIGTTVSQLLGSANDPRPHGMAIRPEELARLRGASTGAPSTGAGARFDSEPVPNWWAAGRISASTSRQADAVSPRLWSDPGRWAKAVGENLSGTWAKFLQADRDLGAIRDISGSQARARRDVTQEIFDERNPFDRGRAPTVPERRQILGDPRNAARIQAAREQALNSVLDARNRPWAIRGTRPATSGAPGAVTDVDPTMAPATGGGRGSIAAYAPGDPRIGRDYASYGLYFGYESLASGARTPEQVAKQLAAGGFTGTIPADVVALLANDPYGTAMLNSMYRLNADGSMTVVAPVNTGGLLSGRASRPSWGGGSGRGGGGGGPDMRSATLQWKVRIE